MNSTFIGLVCVGIVVAGMLLFAISSQRKLPAEKGLVPLYTERCTATTRSGFGLRFGTNLPTCRITLYERAVGSAGEHGEQGVARHALVSLALCRCAHGGGGEHSHNHATRRVTGRASARREIAIVNGRVEFATLRLGTERALP